VVNEESRGPIPGNRSDISQESRTWTLNSYGQWVFSKSRRYVVVQAFKHHCTAVPITSYRGQGVSKEGVRRDTHAIIFTGKVAPCVSDSERPAGLKEAGMLPHPIQVDPDHPVNKLDPMSRIDFAKPTPIDYNCKVKPFGKVNRTSIVHLEQQFLMVLLSNFHSPHGIPSLTPEALAAASLTGVSGTPQTPSPPPDQELELSAYHALVGQVGWPEEKARSLFPGLVIETDAEPGPGQGATYGGVAVENGMIHERRDIDGAFEPD
jgi:hypothetical protein